VRRKARFRPRRFRPWIEPLEDRNLLAAMNYVVTSVADAGAGTLCQAIINHNTNQDPGDTITFNIPGGGVQTISLTSPLDPILYPVAIDGYTQPGASKNTNGVDKGSNAVIKVVLDGTLAGANASGLTINVGPQMVQGDTTIKGLSIINFQQSGILINGRGGVTVSGCLIGLDPTGAAQGEPRQRHHRHELFCRHHRGLGQRGPQRHLQQQIRYFPRR
jgi:hypothetical protein